MKPDDYERIQWVKLFNKFDLYTKVSTCHLSNSMLYPVANIYLMIVHSKKNRIREMSCVGRKCKRNYGHITRDYLISTDLEES
jgi:hypothetical protein